MVNQRRASDEKYQSVQKIREKDAVANGGNSEMLAGIFGLSQLTDEKDHCR